METKPEIKPASAATVILIREVAGALQVYLLRRSEQSGFMGGYYVFPGGRVDPDDRDTTFWQTRLGLPGLEGVSKAGLSAEALLAFTVAAIRETFEEAGVLLVKGHEPAGLEHRRLNALRRAGKLNPGWLNAWAAARSRPPAFRDLLPWSYWITPVGMAKRFDTRFFIVTLPEGQTCSPDLAETTHGLWVSPQVGLEKNLAGALPLSPPALVTLHGLLGHRTSASIRAAAQQCGWGSAIQPRLVRQSERVLILEPWDPEFRAEQVAVDTGILAESVLATGEPFSRLWLDDGCWKPVKCLI